MKAPTARILIRSLGCKVNLADAAEVVERLPSRALELTTRPDQADLVVLNTCVVTHKAERDMRKILGALHRDHPDLPVVVTGCAANLRGDELSGYPNVRMVVPPGDPDAVARRIGECLDLDTRPGRNRSPPSAFRRLGRQRAILKVQDGCNSHCAYCIVPRVRGPESSMPAEDVIEGIRRHAEAGHGEVVLSGIHLGRYGTDRVPPGTLAGLIRALGPVFGRLGPGHRIRLSSIEPLEWTADLLNTVAEHSFICPHFHVPLQSGDDQVLRRMGRPYRADQFADLVHQLHRRMPDAALGTDVLVGFPGETDRAARRTLSLLRSLPLAYLHVFTFSPRPGTRAMDMPDPIDPGCIRERAAEVRKVGELHWQNFLFRGVGLVHQVLIEKATETGSTGHTGSYRPFRVTGSSCRPGQLVAATADRLLDDTLVGMQTGAS